MAITKEQVFEAADRLVAEGQRPTLDAIRQITGGSYSTISPALNEWKSRRQTSAAPLREPPPQGVTDRLLELGADVWAVALDLANGRLTVEREALEKARIELEADRVEAVELADRLSGEMEEMKFRFVSLREELERTHQERDQARDETIAAREELARRDGQLSMLQQQSAELLARIPHASVLQQHSAELQAEPSEKPKPKSRPKRRPAPSGV
jgi:hypothetical protein